MAATYRTSNAGGATAGTGNRTATISAQAGDLLIVGVKWSGNSATNPTCTDNQSGSYDLIGTALNNASADIMALFVRRQQVLTTATITVTPVVGSGTNTAGEIAIVAYSGMTRNGFNAIRSVSGTRQFGKQENQTSGVPTAVLPASALTTNPTLTWAGSTTTAGSVPNASWTERQDASQITPTTVIEVATRDSGFTGTSAAYVSIASAVWSSMIIELDGSVPEEIIKRSGYTPNPVLRTRLEAGFTSFSLVLTIFVATTGVVFRNPLYSPRLVPVHPIELRTFVKSPNLNLIGKDKFFGTFGQSPANLDWPVPKGSRPAIDLRTWTSSGTFENLLTAVVAPFNLEDWPNPRSKDFPTSLRHWDNNLLSTTLSSFQAIFRAPLFARLWASPYATSLLWTDQNNLLANTLSLVQAPFSLDDWPNPRGYAPVIDLRTWLNQLKLNLLSQDTFFGTAGQPPANLDWPVPKSASPVISLKTWINELNILAGKDQFFGLGGIPTFNWPNPKGYTPVIDLRTWINQTDIRLIGKDTFFGEQGQVSANLNWPNPRNFTPVVDLKTWIDKTRIQLIGQDNFFGLAGHVNFDWPNPKGYQQPIDLKTWLDKTKIQLISQDIFFGLAGNPNFDWPNPRGYVPVIDLKTWLDQVDILLIGKDTLFGAPGQVKTYDWVNPTGRTHPISLRQLDFNSFLNTLYAFQAPFNLSDWPLPIRNVPPIVLKTWLDTLKLNLQSQDQFFGLAGNPTLDWPVPKGYVPVISLKTWLDQLKLNLRSQDQFYGLAGAPTFNWPNPRGYQQPIDLKTWIDKSKIQLIGKDTFFGLAGSPIFDWPVPKGALPGISLKTWLDQVRLNLIGKDRFFAADGMGPVYDWPNPRGKEYPIGLRHLDAGNLIVNLFGFVQSPFRLLDWPNPRGATPVITLRTWLESYKLELIGKDKLPFALLDWPVPKGQVPVISLKTWTDLYKILLTGKDKFYGLGGSPVFNWPNPAGYKYPVGLLVKTETGNPNILIPPVVVVVEELQRIRIGSDMIDGFSHWSR